MFRGSRLVLCILVLACAAGAWLSLDAQERKHAIQVENDLVYGKAGKTELKLDLAMPKDGEGPFPALVCIHGGGWREGDRKGMKDTIAALAGRGYVVISPEYRLAPEHRFPAQIEDCKAAVRWLRANAGKYRVNAERIGALGFSAGGHLACMLGVTNKDDGLEGNGGNAEQSSAVQAVVSFFGPTDLTREGWTKEVRSRYITPFLGGALAEKPEAYKKASPITYVRKNAPPFLLIHGTEDKVVPFQQSQDLAEKLQKVGVSARVIPVTGEGHGWRGKKLLETLVSTVDFFNEKLKK